MPTHAPYLCRAPSERPYFSADGETYLAQTPLPHIGKSRPLRVLSEEEFAFWQTYGYVVVRGAVSPGEAKGLLEFDGHRGRLGHDAADPDLRRPLAQPLG
ncbi:hypothetical protein GCM10010121_043370 [Streptomyces brasiliensis]|uniref:Phytanoyl-CoA dioxygenase n=1 Tax=Streptomyces brasiliensis TaxID=1954 RepID=A0A917KTR1_9ACTN|nr:hypothetical protein GCM10010121_043370 [Streptomyces brasiliensis]